MASETSNLPKREGGIYSRVSELENKSDDERFGNVALLEEDLVAIRKIRREDFWTKCVPGAIGSSIGYQVLAKQQKIRHSTLRAVFLSPLVGFILGRVLGLTTVEARLLRYAPHGNLAAAIRKRQGLPPLEPDDSPLSTSPVEQHSDDTSDRKVDDIRGLDDSTRPTYDSGSSDYRWSSSQPQEDAETKKYKTYDEIRRENRARAVEERQQQRDDSSTRKEPVFFSDQPLPEKRKSKGKYGDLWD